MSLMIHKVPYLKRKLMAHKFPSIKRKEVGPTSPGKSDSDGGGSCRRQLIYLISTRCWLMLFLYNPHTCRWNS